MILISRVLPDHDPERKPENEGQIYKILRGKLLYIKEGQYSPMHFHWSKMEDIINRGGGNVLIRVYNSTKDEDLDKVNDVHVHVDGREMVVPAAPRCA